jgi:hypothetical protein
MLKKVSGMRKRVEYIGRSPESMSQQEVLVTVTVDALHVRSAPTDQSTLVATYSRGSVLNYFEVVDGENVAGNPRWGHSVQGHYFWLGGTDHPNG